MVNAHILKGFELFMGINEDRLAKIAAPGHLYAIREGGRIFAETTKARDMHLCHSGKVNISIWVGQPWNRNIVVHRAGPWNPGRKFALMAPNC